MSKILCQLDKRVKASIKLERKHFGALFALAWETIPGRRKPTEQPRLCLDLIFVDDHTIAAYNADYMKHEGPTDVISFPMGEFDPERRAFFLGEAIVSVETAQTQARQRNLPLLEEISRYALHGFLHLVGYTDEQPGPRRTMHALQEKILKLHFERDRWPEQHLIIIGQKKA